jgi:hypothetical protein
LHPKAPIRSDSLVLGFLLLSDSNRDICVRRNPQFHRDYDVGYLGEVVARSSHQSRRDTAVKARSEVIPFDFCLR